MSESPVILFDGTCVLCNRWVRFVIARDPEARFRFAALQSDAGRRMLAETTEAVTATSAGGATSWPDSILLLEEGRVWMRSDAALRIARQLCGPSRWMAAPVGLLPRPLRDALYDFVARHRYRWFGRNDACAVLTPALRSRVIE